MEIYRRGTADDLEQLIHIGLTAYGQFKDILGEDWKKMEATCGNKETYLALLKTATCFVCDVDGETAGMAFFIPSGNPFAFFKAEWCYIRMVGVLPRHEGRGIGKKLTQLCMEEAKRRGENIIALHTSEFQNAARHIYEHLGFRKIKELDRIHGKRYWLYQLELKQPGVVHYRRAGVQDLEALTELRMQFVTLLTGVTDPQRMQALRPHVTAYFSENIISGESIWLLAFQEDRAVAIAGVLKRKNPPNYKNPHGRWGYIVNVYTLPSFRRRGISKMLLETLMEEGRKEGITSCELHATAEGEHVYKKVGFDLHPEPTYRKHFE